MPLGAFRLNSLGKFTVTAAAEVIRSKKGITALNQAQVDTAQSKFGGASALFDGTDDNLFLTSYSDLNFGTNSFTIEFWVRANVVGNDRVVIASNVAAWGTGACGIAGGGSSSWGIRFFSWDYNSSGSALVADPNALSTGVWVHYAVVRNGNSWALYKDGTSVSTATWSGSVNLGNNGTRIGLLGWATGSTYSWNGWIDELRISKTARYTSNFSVATTPFTNDENTVLLLHMDGTDASTFFEDDNGSRRSTAVISQNGAAISTAQSKFGGASALFDGTNDYLNVADNGALSLSGDYTIECWLRMPAIPPTPSNNCIWNCADHLFYIARYNPGSGAIYEIDLFNSGYNRVSSGAVAMNTNQWYHVAISRSGSNSRIFLDGTQVGSTATWNNTLTSASLNEIAKYSSGYWNVYIDEFRISNTARYTANFTAPTAPFVNDANTLLLLHMDGTNASTVFRDDIGDGRRTPKDITVYGNTQISTTQSQIGGSSAYFDGAGDYLVIPNTNPISFGSSNFTIECWYRANTRFTSYPVLLSNYVSSSFTTNAWALIDRHNDSNNTKFTFWIYNHSSSSPLLVSSTSVANGTWYHLAIIRNGNTIKMYVNGTEEASASFTGSLDGGTNPNISIGRANSAGTEIQGWIDELRFSNTARYTANFTAPTTAYSNDSNTLLLMHMDGANTSTVFSDDVGGGRSQRGIQAVGNAQIDTAQSKFGGSSLLLDGTGDYLTVNFHTNTDFEFTAGENFTIECFIRVNAYAQFNGVISLGSARSGNEYTLYIEGISGAYYATAATFGGANLSRGTTNLSTATWHHLAVTRSGTTVRLFVNGTLEDTDTYTFTAGQQSTIKIGSFSDGSLAFNGWIDEVRISNTARYTASFTPTTAPFQNDSNTLLLMHMDSTDATTTFIDDNGKTPS